MSPKWLFFPSPPATGVKLQLDAELVATARANKFNVTNTTLSGSDDVANNYLVYAPGPIRKSTTYIEWLFSLDSSGDYANAGDWETAVTNAGDLITASSTWTHDGVTFTPTSITHTHGSNAGTVVRVRWNASSTDVTNFWDTVAGGETFQIKLNWA